MSNREQVINDLQMQIEELEKRLAIVLEEQPEIVRCKDCKHGSLYCTEDVCGETLIECNRPDLGDVIEIHGWKWFCADGEKDGGQIKRPKETFWDSLSEADLMEPMHHFED